MDSSEDYILTYEEYMDYLDDEPHLLNLGSAEEWPSLSEAYPAFFQSREQAGNSVALTDSAALEAYAKALDETLNGQVAPLPTRPTYLAVLMGTASGRNSPTTNVPSTSPEEEDNRPHKTTATEKIKHKLDAVRHKVSLIAHGFFQKAKHAFESDKKSKKSAHDAEDPEASKAEMSKAESAKEEKASGERKKKLERSKTESVKAEKAERKKLERSKTLEKSKSEKKEKAKKTSPRHEKHEKHEKHEEAEPKKSKSEKKAKKGTSPRPADNGKDTAEEVTLAAQKSADKKDESSFSQPADINAQQQDANTMVMATLAMGYVANDGVFLM